ncbi:MAG: hypothetical protein NT145_05540 [Elusimicrobia bacterium]|nr:hypothetical protein [Elusimicrobiota bacterium]
MVVIMSAANKKYRQLNSKVHAWKAAYYRKDKHLEEPIKPAEITTSEVVCANCGFKARYQFVRCPHCGEERK